MNHVIKYESTLENEIIKLCEYILDQDDEKEDFLEVYNNPSEINEKNMIHVWAKVNLIMYGMGFEVIFPISEKLKDEITLESKLWN